MIGNIRGPPGRLARGHLDDGAAERPDVARPPVTVAAQHLGRHEGDGSLELSLELPRHGRLGHHPRRSPEVCYSQMVTRSVHQ